MGTTRIDGIGDVVRHSWAAILQSGVQLLAWPFFAIGGIGLAQSFLALSSGGDVSPDETFRLVFMGALAGGVVGIGALLRWAASGIRKALYMPADWFLRMMSAIQEEQHDTALEAANAICALQPSSIAESRIRAKAHLYLAFSHEESSHWTEALPWLDRVLSAEPEDAEALVDRAQALQNTEQNAEALMALDGIVADDPELQSRMLSMRISNLTALRRFDEALEICGALAGMVEGRPDAEALLAAVSAHRQEIESARSDVATGAEVVA